MMECESATTIVIFGASGDLTWRKLVPALYNNFKKGRLLECAHIVGFARRPLTDNSFRARLREGTAQFSAETFDPATWEEFARLIFYFQGNLDVPGDFPKLEAFLQTLEHKPDSGMPPGRQDADRLYYLATAPEHYATVVGALGAAGMASQGPCWRRVVIETPFGRDLNSARALNQALHAVFDES